MISGKAPLVLVILDGWGLSPQVAGNAIARANLPSYHSYMARCPHCALACSGEDVGLPKGQMGNSEVGHLTIGAGRVIYQELTRISRSVRDGSFFENEVLQEAVRRARIGGGALHLLGLLSDGGVHSHISHLFALLDLAAREGLERTYIHTFLDGRDVPPAGAKKYFLALADKLDELGFGTVATVMGRYYAMDRDRRWERTEQAYRAMVTGQGYYAAGPLEALAMAYSRGETDEFVRPTVIIGNDGAPAARIKDGDSLIFFNFRPDRTRQLTRAFTDSDFDCFERPPGYPDVHFVCLALYDITIKAPVAFMPQLVKNTLGEVLSGRGIPQLRLAETEKYAHVTFFLNGGVEKPYPGEERILVPSPKVPTYDLQPEMSAFEVTDKFLEQLALDKFGLIVVNYANPDMVGHTGNFAAAVKALEAVDFCLGRLVRATLAKRGLVLITADHGNADEMKDDEGHTLTAHSTNPVPLILAGRRLAGVKLRDGSLRDVAPTVLDLLGLEQPAEMTGSTLIVAGRSKINT